MAIATRSTSLLKFENLKKSPRQFHWLHSHIPGPAHTKPHTSAHFASACAAHSAHLRPHSISATTLATIFLSHASSNHDSSQSTVKPPDMVVRSSGGASLGARRKAPGTRCPNAASPSREAVRGACENHNKHNTLASTEPEIERTT